MKRRRNQETECEEYSPFQKVLYRAGIRAARSIARAVYAISSQELNISAHIIVYFVLASLYCGRSSQMHDDMWRYMVDMKITPQEFLSIFSLIQNELTEYKNLFPDDLHEIAKELTLFARSSFQIQGGYVKDFPGFFEYKSYDAIYNVLRSFFDLNLIPHHKPLSILNPFAGTHAGICVHLLCQYKLSENIQSTWNITAIDPDPIALASASCMLALWKQTWNKEFGMSITMQPGTFLFSEIQKAEIEEVLMHHPEKEQHVRGINPINGNKSSEKSQKNQFDLIIMAPQQEHINYPSEIRRYLESVYQTGSLEYMHVEAIHVIPAKMRVIVQQESWLAKKHAKQYRAWIHQVKPTDILIGDQETVTIWQDVQNNYDRQTITIHKKEGPPFQITWNELDPTQGWKLRDPRGEQLIRHIKSIGQPLSLYLLGEEQDPEDDYLCSIQSSQLMRVFMQIQQDIKEVPIRILDPYNPAERKKEQNISTLYQKKRACQQKRATKEEIQYIDNLLEKEIWEIYQIPAELQSFIMQYAKEAENKNKHNISPLSSKKN